MYTDNLQEKTFLKILIRKVISENDNTVKHQVDPRSGI